jgi:hypothetical protein
MNRCPERDLDRAQALNRDLSSADGTASVLVRVIDRALTAGVSR